MARKSKGSRARQSRNAARVAVQAGQAITPSVYVWGRPTKLTPEIGQKLVEAAQLGLTLSGCCDYVGVTHRSLDNWLMRGGKAAEAIEIDGTQPDETERAFVDFFLAFKKAWAEREILALNDVNQKVERWQAQAWYLERTRPQTYGRRTISLEHSGPDGKPIQAESKTAHTGPLYSDDELYRRMQALEAIVVEKQKRQPMAAAK